MQIVEYPIAGLPAYELLLCFSVPLLILFGIAIYALRWIWRRLGRREEVGPTGWDIQFDARLFDTVHYSQFREMCKRDYPEPDRSQAQKLNVSELVGASNSTDRSQAQPIPTGGPVPEYVTQDLFNSVMYEFGSRLDFYDAKLTDALGAKQQGVRVWVDTYNVGDWLVWDGGSMHRWIVDKWWTSFLTPSDFRPDLPEITNTPEGQRIIAEWRSREENS